MSVKRILGSAGRFGVRYGLHVKRRIAEIESRQRKKQACIFCKGRAKRLSKGIWLCRKCGKKFAGHAYFLDSIYSREESQKMQKSKPLKKEASTETKKKTAKKSPKAVKKSE
jgi:large subunit ribosomal protein L37Ae